MVKGMLQQRGKVKSIAVEYEGYVEAGKEDDGEGEGEGVAYGNETEEEAETAI